MQQILVLIAVAFCYWCADVQGQGSDPCEGIVCPKGQVCQNNVIRCVKAPCPERPGCVPERAILPKPVDPCWNVKCEKDEVCRLHQVWCIRAPCPPIAVCEKKLCEYGEPARVEYTGEPIICGRPNDLGCPKPYQCQLSLGGLTKQNHQKICCPPKEKTICPLPKCLPCESGYYKYDKNGCQTCECDVDPCTKIKCKEYERCELLNVQCFQPPCPPIAECVYNCPLPLCIDTNCQNYKYDHNGCMTCECLDDPCKNHKCAAGQFCILEETCVNQNGCFHSPCPLEPKCMQCPLRKCPPCKHYKYDENNCQTCECYNPCTTVLCKIGYKCVAREVICVTEPCYPIAECIPIDN